MNIHKNARLTFARRLEMVHDILQCGRSQSAAGLSYGVSAPTVRKWLGRYLAHGEAGLMDRSSRPALSPRAIAPSTALAIVELRRQRLIQARIAASLGVSKSTVGRVLARAGLSQLKNLEPAPVIVRYEHAAPGDLLHIDTKKLGRIVRPSHRATGDRRDSVEGAGWEFLFWRSTIMRASASPTCIRMRAAIARASSCATRSPTIVLWACASNAC
jgi:transposase-like protein